MGQVLLNTEPVDTDQQNARLRQLRPADLDRAVELTRAEGWPHSHSDWTFHLELGHGLALEGASGELLGTLIWWEYGDTLATMGYIVVDRRCQGRGLGKKLVQAALDALQERTVRLVSTAAGYSLYRRLGFQPFGPVEQRQAPLGKVEPLDTAPGERVRHARPADKANICRLDHGAFGAERGELLQNLLSQGECMVLERSGHFSGFAIARDAGLGRVIGPVVASCQADAKLLLSHLLAAQQGFCRIDIPPRAGALAGWLDEIGLPPVDRPTAMQNRAPTMTRTSDFHTYALVSQALG